MTYKHTQQAPLHWLLHFLGGFTLVGAGLVYTYEPVVAAIMAPMALVFFVLGLMFAQLTIEDEGEWLGVSFGPLPLFGTRIQYVDISAVHARRSSWIDGWGIHWIPYRGWTFNLWGFDCVELVVGGRLLRIGTDDVENLTTFLQSRLGNQDK